MHDSFRNIFTRANTPWKRLQSTNTALQTQEPMTDSQGLNHTPFGMNDIAGNSSHYLLFRGIGVLDLRYLSPFICCFLLDKENKKVTSFYVFDKACTARHIEMCMSSYSLLYLGTWAPVIVCYADKQHLSQNLFCSVLCVDSVQNLSTHSSIFNLPTSQHPAWWQYLQSGSILVTESKQRGNTRVQ